mgnify:CR=1 FL=1
MQSVREIDFPQNMAENGNLIVMEGVTHVPFSIARVFVVLAPSGATRGQHAHKACSQLLTCPIGKIEVTCTDGSQSETFILSSPSRGLLIEPGIWAQQIYRAPGSVLTVLCDLPYDSRDYIRNFEEFRKYKAAGL